MKFNKLTQLVEQELLLEKRNEGFIVEGLFALALALYIGTGKIDATFKKRFDQYRDKINPSKKFTGIVVKRKLGNDPDWFIVKLTLRLKGASTCGDSFGACDREEIASTRKKINVIFDQLPDKEATKKIMALKEEIINNSKQEVVEFHIIADGIAGETSDGVKGDVKLVVKASEGTKKELKDAKLSTVQEVGWSIKSDAATVGNRSVLEGLAEVAEPFGLTGFASRVEKWRENLAKKDKTGKKKGLDEDFVRKVMKAFKDEIMRLPDSPELTEKIYDFITEQTFGKDKVDLIEVTSNNILELAEDTLRKIRDSGGSMEVRSSIDENGNPKLWFYNKPEDRKVNEDTDEVFHMRVKWEKKRDADHPDVKSGKAKKKSAVFKLMIELGHLAKNPGAVEQEIDDTAEKQLQEHKTKHLTKTPGSYTMLNEMIQNLMGE